MLNDINELLEEINDQELEGAVVGGVVLESCYGLRGNSEGMPRLC